MNKTFTPIVITLLVFAGVVLFVVICLWFGILDQSWIDIGTLLSAVLAVLAFIVSILTLSSIDSVSAVSRMEGNVLENEGYRTDLAQLLHDISSWKADKEGLIELIEDPYKRHLTSGTQLADNLQRTIDCLVLIPFILPSGRKAQEIADLESREALSKSLDRMIKRIEHQVLKFERINAGSNILIDESFKLIKAVLYHQFKEHFPENHTYIQERMPSVRGTMLKNPVSKVVYYNYLGLFYMHKAQELIESVCGESLETIRGMSLCRVGNVNNPERVLDYLDMAERQFTEALGVIGDDIMWNAFIRYNAARAAFFRLRLTGKDPLTKAVYDDSIKWRHRLNVYLADFLEETGNENEQFLFIKNAFIAQELLARLQKICGNMATGQEAVSIYDPSLAEAKQVIDSGNDFGRLESRYKDILERISA